MQCNQTLCEPSSDASTYSCKMTITSENQKSITKICVLTEKRGGRKGFGRTDNAKTKYPPHTKSFGGG